VLKEILLLAVGFALLIKGADWLVAGASAVARRYRVPDLVIGLTIVAFGTSAPEMVVSVVAAVNHLNDVSLANVIGSNIFNLFVVMGIAGLIRPLVVNSSTVWREIPLSLAAAAVLFVLASLINKEETTMVSRFDGVVLLMLFAGFLWYLFRDGGRDPDPVAVTETDEKGFQSAVQTTPQSSKHDTDTTLPKQAWLYIAAGLAGLVFGGKMVVNNAVIIAGMMGMSEKLIALTIVAGGTSLPELATSVVAAYRKNIDIAVGNVIGSNIFNILLILGISSVIRPLGWDPGFNIDLLVLAGGTLLLFFAMFTGVRKRLDRWEAAVLVVIYAGYLAYLTQ
jgi:cation:H+ antiporter